MSVKPKKHLGQHFLKDQSVVSKTVAAIDEKASQYFLEIGPGMGVLTEELLDKLSSLSVIELDRDSVVYLENHFEDSSLKIISGDVLSMDWSKRFDGSLSVVGNFPYNISSQILFKVWDHRAQVNQLVGMFQKEVAKRICSKPKSKAYGILSVLLQTYYDAEYLFTIGSEAFDPPPKVESAVILLKKKVEIPEISSSLLKTVVKAAFGQRRKKLSNALKSLLPNDTSNIDNFLNLRAEQLSISDFIALTKALEDGRKSDL